MSWLPAPAPLSAPVPSCWVGTDPLDALPLPLLLVPGRAGGHYNTIGNQIEQYNCFTWKLFFFRLTHL